MLSPHTRSEVTPIPVQFQAYWSGVLTPKAGFSSVHQVDAEARRFRHCPVVNPLRDAEVNLQMQWVLDIFRAGACMETKSQRISP